MLRCSTVRITVWTTTTRQQPVRQLESAHESARRNRGLRRARRLPRHSLDSPPCGLAHPAPAVTV